MIYNNHFRYDEILHDTFVMNEPYILVNYILYLGWVFSSFEVIDK